MAAESIADVVVKMQGDFAEFLNQSKAANAQVSELIAGFQEMGKTVLEVAGIGFGGRGGGTQGISRIVCEPDGVTKRVSVHSCSQSLTAWRIRSGSSTAGKINLGSW
jgi:hypothetical protein